MAKAKYRLQPVLDMREREKDEAARAVDKAKKQLKLEQDKLGKLKEMRAEVDTRKLAVTNRFQDLISEPGSNIAEEALAHDRYQIVLDQEASAHDQAIKQQIGRLSLAERAVKEKEKELLDATIAVQAMEKHREQWRQEIKIEEQRKEQAIQEELGEVMWLQARRQAAQRSE